MFLTATEVGRELGIQKSRVYELAAGGLLPVVRLGRRMLFPRRGLEELADAAIRRVKANLAACRALIEPRACGIDRAAANRPSRRSAVAMATNTQLLEEQGDA